MTKPYKYLTDEIMPENLELSLDEFGKIGWEFVQLIVMQQQVPNLGIKLTSFNSQEGYHIVTKFKLIFKKEIVELKN